MARNSKLNETLVRAMNAVGVSQTTMAKWFECNQTAISARLKKLNIKQSNPTQILESVFFNLSADEKEWYTNQCINTSAQDVLSKFVKDAYDSAHQGSGKGL